MANLFAKAITGGLGYVGPFVSPEQATTNPDGPNQLSSGARLARALCDPQTAETIFKNPVRFCAAATVATATVLAVGVSAAYLIKNGVHL